VIGTITGLCTHPELTCSVGGWVTGHCGALLQVQELTRLSHQASRCWSWDERLVVDLTELVLALDCRACEQLDAWEASTCPQASPRNMHGTADANGESISTKRQVRSGSRCEH
jgi:hypothetical protein